MRYTLLVLTAPEAGASARHALLFARALLRNGHRIDCVFFFDAGVLTAADHCEPAQDELDLRGGWRELHAAHGIELVACVASAHRFGVADAGVEGGFRIAGLGDLVEASANSDRLLTFRG